MIVSSDDFNNSKISTVLVAVITSNLRLAEAPGNIKIDRKLSKLSKDSVINVSQILTVDKAFLTERVAKLDQQYVNALDDGLKLALDV